MLAGSIKKIVSGRGFGFILPEGGGDDVSFHFTALQGIGLQDLMEGDRMEYEAFQDDKGPKATRVRKIY